MTDKKYKILIEASKILTPHKDGHKRYILDLLRGLLAWSADINTPWEFYVYLAGYGNAVIKPIDDIKEMLQADDPFKHHYKNAASVFGMGYMINALYHKISNYSLRTRINKHGKRSTLSGDVFDMIHLTIPQFYQPMLRDIDGIEHTRFLTTVHDLTHQNYPQFHTLKNIEAVTNGLDTMVRHSSAFMAISNSTANDLLAAYPLIGKKNIHVVYPAFDASKFKRITEDAHLQRVLNKYHIGKTPFLLSLCTMEPRKNIINMIKAFLLLKEDMPEKDLHFVIAGGKGWKYKELFKDTSLRSNHIIYAGFIDEKDLSVIYSAAMALCYVSFYEGFGLPILEAMRCGTPVIYGNNSSMPEVAGTSGLGADPDDIHDIKEKIKKVVMNDKLRETLSAAATADSKQFSMDRFIQGTIHVYEKVLLNQGVRQKR